MLKTKAELKVIVNGKEYTFYCDHDAPTPECKEALFQFGKFIGLIEDNERARLEAEKTQNDEVKEEEKVCPIPSDLIGNPSEA